MRLIIEARLEDEDANAPGEPISIAVLDRADDDLEQLGLTLEEGRELLAAAQSASSTACRWACRPSDLIWKIELHCGLRNSPLP